MRFLRSVGLLGVLALSLCLLGCGRARPAMGIKPQQAAADGETEELVLLHVWPDRKERLENLIGEINASGISYCIRSACIAPQDADEYVRSAVASGETPDLYAATAQHMETFLRLDGGRMLNVNPQARFGDGTAARDGAVSLELFTDSVVLAVNTDMFSRMELQVPANMEQMQGLLSDLLDAGIEVPLAVSSRPDGGQLLRLSECISDSYLLKEGSARDEPDGWNGAVARGAILVKEWVEKGCFGDEYFTRSEEEALSLFMQEKAPLLFCTSAQVLEVARQEPGFSVRLMAFPEEKGMQASHSLNSRPACIAVSSRCSSASAEEALLRFADALAADRELSAGGWIAPRKRMSFSGSETEQAIWKLLRNEKRPAGAWPACEETEKWGQLFMEYLTSDMTADAYERSLSRIYTKK